MVVLWFLHLTVGGMAGVAAWLRVWSKRVDEYGNRDLFAVWLTVSLSALPAESITAVLLLFMARGVTLTWKFTITLFAGTLIADLMRVPLITYLIKPKKQPSQALQSRTSSGEMPPDFWRTDVREAINEGLEPIRARLVEIEGKLKGAT